MMEDSCLVSIYHIAHMLKVVDTVVHSYQKLENWLYYWKSLDQAKYQQILSTEYIRPFEFDHKAEYESDNMSTTGGPCTCGAITRGTTTTTTTNNNNNNANNNNAPAAGANTF
jgi:hypothetical protein